VIVNALPTGWQIIYQRAHALLAGQIALHWAEQYRPIYWMETLAAITQHDDGGREWEGGDLLTPAGAPKDFTLGAITLEQPRAAIMHASYMGQYVALLQSMHICNIYKDFTDQNSEIEPLLKEQTAEQARWRKALNLSKDEADAGYALLYWCDTLSLMLCRQHVPSDGRRIEAGKTPDGTHVDVWRINATGADPRAGDQIVLSADPWVFDGSSFDLGIESTMIEGLTFKNDADVIKAMRGGVIEPLTWRFEKTKPD